MYGETYSDDFKPAPYRPYPAAKDRDAYEALPESVKEACIKEAEEYQDFSFNGLPISAFMDFTRTGNRVKYENLYFAKRHAINALILGECIEHRGRFTDGILNGIYSLCEESAWQLPAHNSYKRDSVNLPLPDVTDPIIDLFAAETGALLATASYLLHDELDAISPAINIMILDNLRRRIFEPYMRRHFWWMGNGSEPMCNWTVWCVQNVLLSVFFTDSAFDQKPDIDGMAYDDFKKKVLEKACRSIDCFLKDYGVDGCCNEGAHYYRRSALCLFNATNILDTVTNGGFHRLFKEKKIRNMAGYIYNVHINDRYYYNFADCSAVMDRSGAMEFLFAKATGNEEMMRYAADDYKKSAGEVNEKEINLFHRLQSLFTAREMLEYDTSAPLKHRDLYYESVGVFIASDSRFNLAVKAGCNNDSHNHNDTGSIILYKDGQPLLIDAGVESYTAKTFSDKRYEIWTMQSAYHNLPTINGVLQAAGAEYKAKDVKTFFSDKVCDISMDIADAYPSEAGVSSYLRHVSLYKESQVVVEDRIVFSNPENQNNYCLNLLFAKEPEISGNTIKLPNASVEFLGDVMLSCETIKVTDERLRWSWKSDLHRVIAVPSGDRITFTVAF
ncbi:MAG: heparinase II/III family protein [Lachnospiraceae bacterium]|nr:heparinase II/III family protein [Lachnospiraceae bacterium]